MIASTHDKLVQTQNFLTSRRLVERLLAASTIGPSDIVYDIGAGTGIITECLARRCRHVVAVEKDPRLLPGLRRRCGQSPHVTLQWVDALSLPLPRTPYKVFASIPFNITAEIIAKLTILSSAPEDAYLVVQREAANRFMGLPREQLVALLLKPWFELTVCHHFRATDFTPPPSVETVMMRLHKRGPPLIPPAQTQAYRDFAVYAFTSRHPVLHTTLRPLFSGQQLKKACRATAFSLDAPPSALRFEQWLELFHQFMAVAAAESLPLIHGAEQRLKRQQDHLRKSRRTRRAALPP